MEEDLFHLLVAGSSRSLSLAGARILAGQLRAAAARRHALAVARVGQSRVCPFDLHALIPVPDSTLRCGPDDPRAQAWLWTHWGMTEMLRHVAEDETDAAKRQGRAAPGEAVWSSTSGRRIGRHGGRWRKSPRAGRHCASTCARPTTHYDRHDRSDQRGRCGGGRLGGPATR